MTTEEKDFVQTCELVGGLLFPVLFGKLCWDVAVLAPVDDFGSAIIFIWLIYLCLRIGPLFSGIIAVLILAFED